MKTVQISLGEILEAMYAELLETYGDKELALAAAQAVSDDLMARFSERPRPVRPRSYESKILNDVGLGFRVALRS